MTRRFIFSEQEATTIGEREFGTGFKVVWYILKPSNLTAFAVVGDGRTITTT